MYEAHRSDNNFSLHEKRKTNINILMPAAWSKCFAIFVSHFAVNRVIKINNLPLSKAQQYMLKNCEIKTRQMKMLGRKTHYTVMSNIFEKSSLDR